MTDVAELGVKIVQDGLRETNDRLAELEKRAAAAEAKAKQLAENSQRGFKGMSDAISKLSDWLRKLDGSIDGTKSGLGAASDAIRRAEDAMGRFTDATIANQTALSNFSRTLKVLVGSVIGGFLQYLSVREYIRLADTWSDLKARVQNAIGPMEDATEVMAGLSDMARVSYSDLGITAEAFINNAQSLQELGLNTKQQLRYQEALNNALVVSGARADRARSVQHAFGAALALGALRGDQLNAVLINGDRISKSLSKELGTTVNNLRKLGAEGKITRDVMLRALLNDFEILREEAELMPATVGDGIQLVRNAMLTLVGTFDTAAGASSFLAIGLVKLSDGIKLLSQNLWAVNGALAAVATVILMRVMPPFIAMTLQLVKQTAILVVYATRWLFARGAMDGAAAAGNRLAFALKTVNAAAKAFVLTAIVAAVAYLVSEFTKLATAVGGFGKAWALVVVAFQIEVERMKSFWQSFASYLKSEWYGIKAMVLTIMANIVSAVSLRINNLVGYWNGAVQAIRLAWLILPKVWDNLMQRLINAAISAAQTIARIIGGIIDNVVGAINTLGSAASKIPIIGGKFEPIEGGYADKMSAGFESLKGDKGIDPGAAWKYITGQFKNGAQNARGTIGKVLTGTLQGAADDASKKSFVNRVGMVKNWVDGITRGNSALKHMRQQISGVGQAAETAGASLEGVFDPTGLGAGGAGTGGAGGGAGGGGKGGAGGQSEAQKLLEQQAKALSDLEGEVEKYRATVAMTALEEEIWNNQKATGALLDPQRAQYVRELTIELDRLRERQAAMRQMAETIESSFGQAFTSIVTGASNARDAIGQLLQSLAKMFADQAFQALWGRFGGSILGAFGLGGGPINSSAWRPGFNANGTNNWRGGLTSVNERGGEIIDLPSGSRVYPHDISKKMAENQQDSISKVVLEILPSGEFRTQMQEISENVSVEVVKGYDKGPAIKRAQRAIKQPRKVGI